MDYFGRAGRVIFCSYWMWTNKSAGQRRLPVGMSATNSGITPEPGFSYSNLFLFYSRNELKGPDGEVLATGGHSVLMDLNSFVWVSKKEILGGAKFSLS